MEPTKTENKQNPLKPLTITREELFSQRRKLFAAKARKHLKLALHWIDRMRDELS